MELELSSLDTVDWPEGLQRREIVPMFWPERFTGVGMTASMSRWSMLLAA